VYELLDLLVSTMAQRFQWIVRFRGLRRRPLSSRSQIAGNLLVFLAALLLHAVPASAVGPRDDVVAGMFRCAAVGDMRVWLDCFYGAAQPVRAALGLKPVPNAQARLVANPPAGAQSGDPSVRYQTTSDVLRCNNLSQDRQWLDCYYAAAQPVRAQLGLSPAPQVRPAMPAHEAGNAEQKTTPTGFPISSRMASYSFNRYGQFTVVLTNGQTWRQLPGDTSAAHWTKTPPGYTVQISHGALRSFNLKVKGISTEYKVERIN
jgi:hypothetical protein